MSTNRALALIAAVLGSLALLAGGPERAALDPHRLAAAIQAGEDEIAPLTLARWIRAGDGVRVVDLGPADAFAAGHVPTAVNVALDALVDEPASPGPMVLYGGGLRVGQAWVLLRVQGRDARVLRGGLDGWVRDVMSPVLPENAPTEAHAAFEETKALSRWFGGTPRIGPAVTPLDPDALPIPGARGGGSAPPSEDAAAALRRRGC